MTLKNLDDKINDTYFPYIKLAMKAFFHTPNVDFMDTWTTFAQAAHYIEANIEIEKRILFLVSPDRYLKCIYEMLITQGTAVIPDLHNLFNQFYLKEEEESISKQRTTEQFKKKFTIMKMFDLITHEMVSGTKGAQNFYIAPFCTEEQYNISTKNFKKCKEYHEFYKTIVYKHISDKTKDVEKSVEDITKEAFKAEMKDTVKKQVKQVTRNKFHCCNTRFSTQYDLEQHWLSKQITFRDTKTCSTCGLSWSEFCEHNCQYSFEDKKEAHIRQVKTLLDAKVSSDKLLTKGPNT